MSSLWKRDPFGQMHAKLYQKTSKMLPGYKYREAFANNLFGGSVASKMGYQRFDKEEPSGGRFDNGNPEQTRKRSYARPRGTPTTLLDEDRLGG